MSCRYWERWGSPYLERLWKWWTQRQTGKSGQEWRGLSKPGVHKSWKDTTRWENPPHWVHINWLTISEFIWKTNGFWNSWRDLCNPSVVIVFFHWSLSLSFLERSCNIEDNRFRRMAGHWWLGLDCTGNGNWGWSTLRWSIGLGWPC